MGDPRALGETLRRFVANLGPPRSPEEIEAFQRKRRRAALRELAELRGVPGAEDVLDYALEASASGVAVDAVREALRWRRQSQGQRSACRVLLSSPGVGKTVALAYAVTHSERPAYYTTSDRLTSLREYEARDVWARARKVDLLALDELGTEREGDSELVTKLLLDRWTDGKATLCASNLAGKELSARYLSSPEGQRLSDRLQGQNERGLKAILSLKGRSQRHSVKQGVGQ